MQINQLNSTNYTPKHNPDFTSRIVIKPSWRSAVLDTYKKENPDIFIIYKNLTGLANKNANGLNALQKMNLSIMLAKSSNIEQKGITRIVNESLNNGSRSTYNYNREIINPLLRNPHLRKAIADLELFLPDDKLKTDKMFRLFAIGAYDKVSPEQAQKYQLFPEFAKLFNNDDYHNDKSMEIINKLFHDKNLDNIAVKKQIQSCADDFIY